MEPRAFHSVVASATAVARVSLAFFDGAEGAAEPTCVALLECSAEAARAMLVALRSALEALEQQADA